jgi:hypothetical protein
LLGLAVLHFRFARRIGYDGGMLEPIDLFRLNISPEILEMMPPRIAHEAKAIPIGLDDRGALIVAMADMFDFDTCEKLMFILNRPVTARSATAAALEYALSRYYP